MNRKLFVPGLVLLALLTAGAGSVAALDKGARMTDPAVDSESALQTGQTIGVMGIGAASIPAETVTIQMIVSQGFYYFDHPMPEWEPSEDLTDETIDALIDDLTSSGISADVIEVNAIPYGYFGPGTFVEVLVAHDDVDADSVTSLVDSMQEVILTGDRYTYHVGARYHSGDCHTALTEARLTAMQNAEAHAGSLAQSLDVELGEWISVVEYPYYGHMSAGECDPYEDPHGVNYFPPLYDLMHQPAEVRVVVQLEIAFAVR